MQFIPVCKHVRQLWIMHLEGEKIFLPEQSLYF